MTHKVLIAGGGVSGLLMAQRLSSHGVKCIVAEQRAVVGGKAAALLDADADRPLLVNSHVTEMLAQLRPESLAANIEILTLTDITAVASLGASDFDKSDFANSDLDNSESGGDHFAPGFQLSLLQQPRFVTDSCTRCNHCTSTCPQAVANEYDENLTVRKAIHSPYPKAFPAAFSIDIESCMNVPPNYLPCQRCVQVCDDQAIDFSMTANVINTEVDAIVLACGDSTADLSPLAEFGYGRYPDCVTSEELRRLLENPGPSGGFAIRPSNEEYPERVLMVLDKVSDAACYQLQMQLQQLKAQDIEHVDILVLEQQAGSPALDEMLAIATLLECNVHRAAWLGIDETVDDEQKKQLEVHYLDFASDQSQRQNFDLVVFAIDRQVSSQFTRLADMLNLQRDDHGYALNPVSTSVSTSVSNPDSNPDSAIGDSKTDGSQTNGSQTNNGAINPGITSVPGVFVSGSAAGCIGLENALLQTENTVATVLAAIQSTLAVRPANSALAGNGTTHRGTSETVPGDLNQSLDLKQPLDLQQMERMVNLLMRLGEGPGE